MPVVKRSPEGQPVKTIERPGTTRRPGTITRREFTGAAAALAFTTAALGLPALAWLAQRSRPRTAPPPSEGVPIPGERPVLPKAKVGEDQPLPVGKRLQVELIEAQVREKVELMATREPVRFEVGQPEVVFETTPLEQAPKNIPQPRAEELIIVPSADELRVRVPNLVTAIFEGEPVAIEAEAAWLHQNAPVQTEILAVDIFSTANRIAETVPASLIANMAQAVIALQPGHIQETLPQLTILLERALRAEAERKAQEQANRQALLEAIENLSPETKPVNIPQGKIAPEGVHLETPADIAEHLTDRATGKEQKWLPGPVALPVLCVGWFGRDWMDALTSEFRAFLGLTDLKEATWRVTHAGTMADLLPAVFRGGRLEKFANNLPYVKLNQESGALAGIKIPVYMANFADFRERDLFRVTTVGEYALERLFGE